MKRKPKGVPGGGQFDRDVIQESGIDIAKRASQAVNPMLDGAEPHVVTDSAFDGRRRSHELQEDIADAAFEAVDKGRRVREVFDRRYDEMQLDQRAEIRATERLLQATPFKFVASGLWWVAGGRIAWGELWRGWRLRKVITDAEFARYGALLLRADARDPAKGYGREHIENIRASIWKDRADAEAARRATQAEREAPRESRLPIPPTKPQGLPTKPPRPNKPKSL